MKEQSKSSYCREVENKTRFKCYRQCDDCKKVDANSVLHLKKDEVCEHEWTIYLLEHDIEICKKCIALRFNYD